MSLVNALLINTGAVLASVVGAALLFNVAAFGGIHFTTPEIALLATCPAAGGAIGTVRRHRAKQGQTTAGSGIA